MTDAFIIKSMSDEHRRLVYKAFLEFAKEGETTAEFMARMCVDWCVACLAEKECIDKMAAGLVDDDDRSENDEQSSIALSSDFDKSEKDCMWERD